MLNIAGRPGILAVLLAVYMVTVPPAEAGTAGRQKGRDVTPIYMLPYTLLANTGYVIETTNLSAGADTVLHVNERVTGAFIDGNDDCGTRLPGCQGLRSYVSIPPASTDRLVWIMVRSYGAYYGEATLTISPGTQYQISFTGGMSPRAGKSYRTWHASGSVSA